MSTIHEFPKETDTKHEGLKNESLENVCRLSSSSLGSTYAIPRAPGSPRVPDRTTRTVLEDIFFTYVGCPSTKDFFALQKDGIELQHRIKQGWNIQNVALEPVVPERLLAWYTGINIRRELIHEDALCSTLFNSTTRCYLKHAFANNERDQRLLMSLILPPLDALPAPKRCNIEAISAIRDLVGQHLRDLLGLVEAVLNLKGCWGRLNERERSRLQGVIKAVRATRVKSLATLQKGFVELNFSNLGLSSVSAEMANYTEVRALRLDKNANLRHLPVVPPACQTVLAGACSLETVGSVPKLVEPSTLLIFSRVLVMGLSYNCLTNLAFTRCFPCLRVLDITGNRVASLNDTVASLQEHEALVDVYLAENPVSLLDGYRHCVVKACQRLEQLDGQLIRAEERTRKVPLPPEAIPVFTETSVKQRLSSKKNKELYNTLSPSSLRSSPLTRSQSDALTNTVFVSAQIVALRHISTLLHTPLSITSIDELLPSHSDIWMQVANAVPCFDSSRTHDDTLKDRPTLAELWATHNLDPRPGSSKLVHHTMPLYTCTSSLTLKGGWGGPIIGPDSDAAYHVPISLTDVALTTASPINGTPSRSAGVEERFGGKIPLSGTLTPKTRRTEGRTTPGGGPSSRGKSPVAISGKEIGDVYRPPPDRATFTGDIPISEELSELLARTIRLRVEIHDTLELTIANNLRTLSRGSRQETESKTLGEPQGGRRQNLRNFKTATTHTAHLEASTQHTKDMVETHVYQLGDIFLHPGSLLALPSTSFYCSQLVLKGKLLLSEADRQAELKSLREDQAALRKALEAYARAPEVASVASMETSDLIERDNLNWTESSIQYPMSLSLTPSSRQGHHKKNSLSFQAPHLGMMACPQRVLLCGARVVARIARLQELYKSANNIEVEVKLSLGRGPINPALQEVVPRKAKGASKHSNRAK